MIALHSPSGFVETGLFMCPPEKKSSKARLVEPPGHFLRFGLMAGIANCGVFQRFSEEYSLVSLHLRLSGGEGGIRTPDTR